MAYSMFHIFVKYKYMTKIWNSFRKKTCDYAGCRRASWRTICAPGSIAFSS
jgi:hypothetical protein